MINLPLFFSSIFDIEPIIFILILLSGILKTTFPLAPRDITSSSIPIPHSSE